MNSETIAAFAPLARAIPEALLIFVGNATRQRRGPAQGHGAWPPASGPVPGTPPRRRPGRPGRDRRYRRLPADGPRRTARPRGRSWTFLRLGVPTIVSDVGSFSCYPDSVVRKHRWDSDGLAGLTQALRELAVDRPRREVLGRAAWTTSARTMAGRTRPTRMKRSSSGPSRGRSRPQADGTSALPGPQVVASPEWLQAAS